MKSPCQYQKKCMEKILNNIDTGDLPSCTCKTSNAQQSSSTSFLEGFPQFAIMSGHVFIQTIKF